MQMIKNAKTLAGVHTHTRIILQKKKEIKDMIKRPIFK